MQNKNDANGKLALIDKAATKAADRGYYARISDNPLAKAFPKKSVIHAGFGGVRVEQDAVPQLWSSLMQTNRYGKTAAYIHIPFCETKCVYCGFFANPTHKHNQKLYTDALINQIAAESDSPAVKSYPVHAVYLGGGTPTALEAKDLKRILLAIKKYLPLVNDCEITVEGRIFNFGEDKIDACLEGGANRFSIGVQSFDTGLRKTMGRLASKQEIIERLEMLKNKDQAAIVIDLIFGLPGQSMKLWEKDITTFLELNIDGVDLYQLIQFPGGMLKKAFDKNLLPPAADTTQRSVMFARGVELMTDTRCRRLSISHWGRGSRERNLYNLFMKAKANCLAFGSGAGGVIDGTTYFIEGNLEKYLNQAGKSKQVAHMMKPSKHERMICLVAGELELGRIDLNAVGRQLERDLIQLFKPLVTQWIEAGLVTYQDGWMTLTLAGEFWQTNVAQGMIDFYIENVSKS